MRLPLGLSGPAAAVVAICGLAGITHFVNPDFFDPLVPDWMPGSARTITYVSGVAEVATAVLVLVPRTRRVGGWVALALFAAVWPANIQAAIDGGMSELDPPFDSAWVAWLRVPLQLPLFWLAYRVARPARPAPSPAAA